MQNLMSMSNPASIKELYLGEQLKIDYSGSKIGGTIDLRKFINLNKIQMNFSTLDNLDFLAETVGYLPPNLYTINFQNNDFVDKTIPSNFVKNSNLRYFRFFSTLFKGQMINPKNLTKIRMFSIWGQRWSQWHVDNENLNIGTRWKTALRYNYYNLGGGSSTYDTYRGLSSTPTDFAISNTCEYFAANSNNMSSTDLDRIIIAFANAGATRDSLRTLYNSSTLNPRINLNNNYAMGDSPITNTSASHSAFNDLIAKGWTITGASGA